MKNILIFSNPFGYGPTGKAMSLLTQFQRTLMNDRVTMVGNGLCLELLSDNTPHVINLDQRDEQAIRQLLTTIEEPHVIGCQNRFCIQAAANLGIPSAFVDGLAWFWPTLPDDHLLADHTFWINYPGISNKLPPNKKIDLVGAILPDLPPATAQPSHIVIHFGGAENPLTKSLPINYLSLLAEILNRLDTPYRVTVVGGKKAGAYLATQITNPRIQIKSLHHEAFLNLLAQTKHLITTAGQTATQEAFAMEVPTSFMLSSNLSQDALCTVLKTEQVNIPMLEWSNYTPLPTSFVGQSEKEAIATIEIMSAQVLDLNDARTRLYHDFQQLVNTIPDTKAAQQFINMMGTQGAKQIADILSERWHLT